MARVGLRQLGPPRSLISLVPMIDVMLILLVFFMVTSTYLDLDMVPAVEEVDDNTGSPDTTSESSAPLLIRLGANGQPTVRGATLSKSDLGNLIRTQLDDDPLKSVLILPSGAADMQALITVMDVATVAGATRLRVVRLEAR